MESRFTFGLGRANILYPLAQYKNALVFPYIQQVDDSAHPDGDAHSALSSIFGDLNFPLQAAIPEVLTSINGERHYIDIFADHSNDFDKIKIS